MGTVTRQPGRGQLSREAAFWCLLSHEAHSPAKVLAGHEAEQTDDISTSQLQAAQAALLQLLDAR